MSRSSPNPAETDQQATPGRARDAFDTALEAVRLAEPRLSIGDREFVYVPRGMSLQDLTDPERLRSRAHERIAIDEKQTLIEYVNRFALSGSVMFADFDSLSIKAVIDYHDESDQSKPGAVAGGNHVAHFALRPSEEWTRWDKFEGDFHDQAAFAAFLEENSVDIKLPDPATMIELSRDLEAVQSASFKSSTRLENGDRAFRYETETQTRDDVVVPREFTLSIPLYQGELPVELRAALRWRPTGGGVVFGFEWRRVQYQRLAYFRSIATEVVEATGVPVFYGRKS